MKHWASAPRALHFLKRQENSWTQHKRGMSAHVSGIRHESPPPTKHRGHTAGIYDSTQTLAATLRREVLLSTTALPFLLSDREASKQKLRPQIALLSTEFVGVETHHKSRKCLPSKIRN